MRKTMNSNKLMSPTFRIELQEVRSGRNPDSLKITTQTPIHLLLCVSGH